MNPLNPPQGTTEPKAPAPNLMEQWFRTISDWTGSQIVPGLALHQDGTQTYYAIDLGTEDPHGFALGILHTQIELSHLPEPSEDQPATKAIFGEIKDRRPASPIVEVIFAIDMYSKPGQGIEFDDFLAVYHWAQGEEWRHGVLDYRIEPAPPIFRPIKWEHPFWQDKLRRQHQRWAQKERDMMMGMKSGLWDGRTVYAVPGFEGLRVPDGRREAWDMVLDADHNGGRIYASSEPKLREIEAYVRYVMRADADLETEYFGPVSGQEGDKLHRYSVGFRYVGRSTDNADISSPAEETK